MLTLKISSTGNHAADVLKVEGHTDGVDGTPFGVPAIQGAQPSGRLPGSPRANSSAQLPRPNATQAAMDHKRAFQAVNAETLELALQDINYEMPPHKVNNSAKSKMHCSMMMSIYKGVH